MRLLSRLRHNALTFRDETRGSIPIEALLAFTFLAWWYVASFQFFDALRQKSINLKAAYTLGDLISRETGPDPADPAKVADFCRTYPGVKVARGEAEILEDATIQLVTSAPVPRERCPLGLRVLRHGKDYFTDKPPMTTLAQLAEARATVAATRRIYAVYYAERLHVEAAVYADQLIKKGAIGRVLQVLGLGPHRINAASRPPWFWQREKRRAWYAEHRPEKLRGRRGRAQPAE
jgi:hypothetical protein